MADDRGPLGRAVDPRWSADRLSLAWRSLAQLGPRTVSAIAVNSVVAERRRRAARRSAVRWVGRSAEARGPGRLLGAQPVAAADGQTVGARCRFTEAELEVLFLRPGTVRVTWLSDHALPSWGLTDWAAAPEGSAVALERIDEHRAWVVQSPELRVEVGADGSLRYVGSGGRLVRHELAPLRRGTERTLQAVLRPGERVLGLGEQSGALDLSGSCHRLWSRDPGGVWTTGGDPLYGPMPVLLGCHPQGDVLVVHHNPADGEVAVDCPTPPAGRSRLARVTFRAGLLCHFVAVGTVPELAEQLAELTGRPAMPPRWALGHHQSRWGYRDEADVRAVSDGFEREGLPLSAVHLDIDHMDGYRVFTTDPDHFPDLTRLADEVGERGTRLVAIVDPGVKVDTGYDVYREGVDEGHFVAEASGRPHEGVGWCGPAAFPDFTREDTRRWWGDLARRLTGQGVAGLWHDMNEPTSMALWGDRSLPPDLVHAAGGRGAEHRACHNAYGLLMDRAGWEGLARAVPGRRPFVLSRSAWLGVQRWAFVWTGDAQTSWEGLRQQVPTAVGLSLSGVPFVGSDTGGFTGAPTPELYLRWLELSVLMPFCRTHHSRATPPREPWRFPEPYRAAVSRLVRLRYRLLPYLYSLADEAARTGRPLVRPWTWDGTSRWDEGAYLLGDALAVAPVCVEGQRRRTVHLPAGWWYRWRATPGVDPTSEVDDPGEPVSGSLDVDAPLGQPVVFVRAGTVLPLDDGWAGEPPGPVALDAGHAPRLPALHCFADRAGRARGRVFDDAGDGWGPWRRDDLVLEPVPAVAGGLDGAALHWSREGVYPAPARVLVVVHGSVLPTARVDGRPVPADAIATGSGATVVSSPAFGDLVLEPAPAR